MGAMDLSQIRYFNAVARYGSFSAAAKALGVTQPGLTKAIRRLETSLDCALFVRLPRGVALTQQGQALLRHASRLDVQLQDARNEVRAVAGGAVGELRIGAGPSWLGRALPRIVAELSVKYPGLSFHVVGGYNGMLMEALRSGDLDLVVSALPDQSPEGLQAIPLTTDTISVVARRSHPLRTKRRPQPSSTLDYPWVLPGRDVLLRSRLEALFRVTGLQPPPAKIESDSISFIAAVLRDSNMLSFATSRVLSREMDGIVSLLIPALTMTRSAGILFRSGAGNTPATRAFIEAIKKLAHELGPN
jgi:LysR family transcriptional regulator of gallate degradation